MYDLGGTELNFVHKRIIGAIGGGLTGGAGGAIGGFLGGGGRRRRSATPAQLARERAMSDPRFQTPAARSADALGHIAHGHIPFTSSGHASIDRAIAANTGGAGGCGFGKVWDSIRGKCVFGFGDQPGPEPGGIGGGNAVMGRFGAALVPDVDMRRTLVCLPGMILGKDDLCYNKGEISNKQRMWPKGRKPLGTPGEMAALAKAASFGRRMETTVKRMQSIGVLKKPAPRAKSTSKPKMLTSGEGVRVVNVE